MPSERIKAFKDEHVTKVFCKDGYVNRVYLSILRSRTMTEVWKETEGEPTTLRKAKAISRYLDTMPIFIRPTETIVGFYAEDPHALPVTIEATDPGIIRLMIACDQVKPEEKEEWEELVEYWELRGLNRLTLSLLNEEECEWPKHEHGYVEALPSMYTSRAQAEYDLVLEHGLKGIIEILKKKFDDLAFARESSTGGASLQIAHQMVDLRAMIISAEAVIRLSNRYSQLASDLAQGEKSSARKQELLDIAERCAYVPANCARTFLDAIQSHWLCFQVAHMIEYLSHGTSLRLDQLFWPWYKDDVMDKKTQTRERALEAMEEFLLKVDEMGRPLPLLTMKILQGTNFMATYTIGGVHTDGSDACNETTMLILDAIDDLNLSHPDFKFRWHPNVSPKAYQRALEVISLGLGQPSIKNDEVAIDGLMNHFGYTLEEARTWAVVGCISPAPTLNWGRARRDAWSVAPAKYLELTLFNGVNPINGKKLGLETGDPKLFNSFDEFFEAFTKQFRKAITLSARIRAISQEAENALCKRPFLSTMFRRCHESCRDVMDTPDKSMPWVNDPGIVDTVDSLIGIKRLIYDEKKYTMADMCKALQANWVGYEKMRQDFINAPKFGNNDDYADEVAVRTYTMVADEMSKVTDCYGQSPMPSGLIVTFMWALADKTGALPNGRKLGDPLADAGISPHSGYDKNGPMAAILSASKIDARKQKANIFNQKLSPSCIKGQAGLKKLQDYTTSIMKLGLDMVQFNVIDAATLKEAQAKPEQYKDLVVRISGYNSKFVELDEFVQNAVIARTEHSI
ncbi:MAG: pyruvate formate lyase family protein [Thermodesulfobacteriota bacterium]